MTTEQQPAAIADPWAKPAPLPHETPEETRRIAQRSLKNQQLFVDLFDDLLKEHRGRWLLIYGDRQVAIGDDPVEMKNALSDDERKTVVCVRIAPWSLEYE